MFFLDRKIVRDRKYGNPGYRYTGCQVIHTFKQGDKESEKRALMRANNDKKYAERQETKPQRYIPIKSLMRSDFYGNN